MISSATSHVGPARYTAAVKEPVMQPLVKEGALALSADISYTAPAAETTHESHRLPGTLASAGKARGLVEHFLHRSGHTDLAEAATLVVSEFVANAVKHGRPPVHLDLAWLTGDRPALRVDVHDHGRVALHSVAHDSDDEAESGRGLFLIECMTDRWGLTPHPVHGTHAWAEIEAVTA